MPGVLCDVQLQFLIARKDGTVEIRSSNLDDDLPKLVMRIQWGSQEIDFAGLQHMDDKCLIRRGTMGAFYESSFIVLGGRLCGDYFRQLGEGGTKIYKLA